jgi:CRP-like cAMP-binding protein
MKLLEAPEKIQHEDFQELLQRFLPGIASPVLALLEDIHELRRYEPGEVFMEAGKNADGVFVLRSGAAMASPLSKSGPKMFPNISAPAILGLSETILGESNKSTWVCLHTVEAVLLPASSFIQILRRFPVVSLQFSKLLSDDLVATYSLLADMRTKCGLHRESPL